MLLFRIMIFFVVLSLIIIRVVIINRENHRVVYSDEIVTGTAFHDHEENFIRLYSINGGFLPGCPFNARAEKNRARTISAILNNTDADIIAFQEDWCRHNELTETINIPIVARGTISSPILPRIISSSLLFLSTFLDICDSSRSSGLSIFSRYKLLQNPTFIPFTSCAGLDCAGEKGFLSTVHEVQIQIDGKPRNIPFEVATLHLQSGNKKKSVVRNDQMNLVNDVLNRSRYSYPGVILGDFQHCFDNPNNVDYRPSPAMSAFTSDHGLVNTNALGNLPTNAKCKVHIFVRSGFVDGIQIEPRILDSFIDPSFEKLLDHQAIVADIALFPKI